MKIHFNKELVITKEQNEDLSNSTKCWICNKPLENIEAIHMETVI